MSSIDKQMIEKLLEELISAPSLECDGFTRMALTLLYRHSIPCKAFMGELVLKDGRAIPLHFWLECGSFLIDYKARMWLGEDALVPHGTMLTAEVCHLYHGQPVDMQPLPDPIYKLMML